MVQLNQSRAPSQISSFSKLYPQNHLRRMAQIKLMDQDHRVGQTLPQIQVQQTAPTLQMVLVQMTVLALQMALALRMALALQIALALRMALIKVILRTLKEAVLPRSLHNIGIAQTHHFTALQLTSLIVMMITLPPQAQATKKLQSQVKMLQLLQVLT